MTGSTSSTRVDGFHDALAEALRSAGQGHAGSLHFAKFAMPPDVDPLLGWHAVADDEFASFWESDDETLAGLGIAARGDPADHHHPAMPRWFGAMPFVNGWSDDDWAPIVDVGFVLPRWTLHRTPDGVTACLALRAPVRPGEPERIEAEFGRVVDAVDAVDADDGVDRSSAGDGDGTDGAPRRFTPPDAWFARAFWEELVRLAIDEIAEGRLDKVVLARRIAVPLPPGLTAVDVLRRLRAEGSGPFRFGVRRRGRTFLGASPEYLFRKRGDAVRVEALAGTFDLAGTDQVAGGSEPADGGSRGGAEPEPGQADLVRAAEHLFASGKDLEEHALVVRGVVEALRPVAKSVVPDEWPAVRRARRLAHLSTTIRGFLADGVTALDLIEALHPTPAVCGLPREAAMRFIRRNEPVARGLFAAPVGWVDAAGDACVAVGIRSALMLEAHAWVYGGAGIVSGSDPAGEWEETSAKLRWFAELAAGEPGRATASGP